MTVERGPEGREGPVGREGVAGREGLPGEAGVEGEVGAQGPRGKTGEALPRSVRTAFIVLVFVFTLMLAVLGYYAAENHKRSDEGREAKAALCVIKANFVIREDRTQDFLDNHPGATIIGIKRAEFERSLADTRDTLKALGTLVCDPLPAPTSTGRIP